MASGSFSTSSKGYTLKTEWSSTINVAKNTSTITCNHYLICPYALYISGRSNSCTVNGESKAFTSPAISTEGGTIHLGTTTYTVSHNADGKKSVSASTTFNIQATISGTYIGSMTASGTITLDNIPRYLTINSFNITNITETTAIVSWSVSDPRSSTYYSLDGGTTWVGSATYGESLASDNKSGTFNITGLTAGTNYNIKIKIKRTDNSLWTESASKSFSTYDFPHCNNTPNFTIGDKVNIGLYNPLGRNCTVTMQGADGSTIYSGDGWTGTSIGEFVTDTIISNLYKSIPNSKSGQYKIFVKYGSSERGVSGGTYSVRGTEAPTINGFDYIDNNSATVGITGDATKIVQNHSELLVRFHEATLNYSAGSISQYYIECNGKKANGSKAGSYSLGTIDSSNDVDLTLTVVDSRGLSSSKTIKVSMLSYSKPSFTVFLERLNNYEDETYLKVDGSISSVNGGNKIEVLQYRYKVSGGEYGDYFSIEDNKQYTLSLNKENAFIFEIIIKDTIGTVYVETFPLGKGVFPLFIDTVLNSVGINCFPKEVNSLEVNELNIFTVAKNVSRAMKNILLGSNDGLTIAVENFGGTDKIPIIIAGADNSSMTPVFTIIHMRSGSGFGHINLGLDSTITRDGNRLHMVASQWSYFNVIVPLGCEITLSNSPL